MTSERKRHRARTLRLSATLLLTASAIPGVFAACNSSSNNANSCPIEGTLAVGAPLGSQAVHAPEVVRDFQDQGGYSPAEESAKRLTLTISLALNNETELDQRLAAMYQPGNPAFHHFMSASEFRARYAPTSEQVQAAREFLEGYGLEVEASPIGQLVHASGSVQAAEEAFQTRIHRYEDAAGNSYYAPSDEPSLPLGLSIQAVHGLDNVARPRSFARAAAAAPQYAAGVSGYGPSQIRAAYGLPSNVNGSGQTIALVELDGFNASDISGYEAEFGLGSSVVQPVLVDGFSGAPGADAIEVTLDIELTAAVAPGARILVYEAPNSAQSLVDIYNQVANDDAASQVSVSWGAPEASMGTALLQTENSILKRMAAQGQSVYAAAGDSGAFDNGATLSVGDPASQPFVVAVGGTELTSDNGIYVSETTWNNGSPSAGAGGGGVSAAWSQPSWQNGAATAYNYASTTMRNVPDVSLNADPEAGYAVYYQGVWGMYGGTSCAAPIWTAFTALVNQARVSSGLGVLGFANPYLYAIGKGPRSAVDFHDIADGSNNLYYPAVSGYDDATGWGSLNGQNLFQDLSTDPQVSSGSGLSC